MCFLHYYLFITFDTAKLEYKNLISKLLEFFFEKNNNMII